MVRRVKKHSGFTLAEAMIATVVLGIAAAGVLLPFTSGAAAQNDSVNRTLAAKLAGELMEMIVATPFALIVDSYDGYAESIGQVKGQDGQIIAGPSYAGFSRDASCEYVCTPQESGIGGAKFILATIRVYHNGSQIVVVKRLIGS